MIGSNLPGNFPRLLVIENGRDGGVPKMIPSPHPACYGGQIVRLDNGKGPAANHVMPVADLLRAIANVRPLLWG